MEEFIVSVMLFTLIIMIFVIFTPILVMLFILLIIKTIIVLCYFIDSLKKLIDNFVTRKRGERKVNKKNKKFKNKNIDTNQDSFANYNDKILEQKLLKNFSMKDYEDFLNIKEINFYEINRNGEKGKKVLTLDRLDNIGD